MPTPMKLSDLQQRGGGGSLIQKRELPVEIRAVEDGNEIEFSFSSETPVERYFGTEVLSHESDAADLSRLNDGAPFLWNHDRDAVLGVVREASMAEDRRGYTRIKWSRNAMAQEKRQDVEDGILRNVSFAYSIDEVQERDGQVVVTRWTPLEVSLVSIPADNTVGLGRAFDEGDSMAEVEPETSIEVESSQPDSEAPDRAAEDVEAASAASPTIQPEEVPEMEAIAPDMEGIRSEAVKAERDRIAAITALGEKHGMADMARELIDGGRSLAEAREAVLDKLGSRKMETPIQNTDITANDLGLTEKETRNFSFVRALNYLANPNDKQARAAAAFEIEVSEAASRKYDKPASGIMVPNEVLRRDLLNVGTPSEGGDLVATDLLAGSFIDLLRNRMALAQVGVTMLTGLQGNVAIPRQTGASTAYWVGEGDSPTQSQPALDQVTMNPKTVGAFVDYSRKLLLQSSVDIEAMVRNDLARVIALEIDRAGIYGLGNSNQPKGIVEETGIGSVTLTGFGTFEELVELETEVATANADFGSLYYLMNAGSRGALKTTEKVTASGARFVFEDGEVNGYPVVVSNQLANKDIIFGNFSQMIMGMWSGLDLTVDPYFGSTSGTVRIVALQDVDVAVRQPGAFAYGQSAGS